MCSIMDFFTSEQVVEVVYNIVFPLVQVLVISLVGLFILRITGIWESWENETAKRIIRKQLVRAYHNNFDDIVEAAYKDTINKLTVISKRELLERGIDLDTEDLETLAIEVFTELEGSLERWVLNQPTGGTVNVTLDQAANVSNTVDTN
jgi:hypothetical protein